MVSISYIINSSILFNILITMINKVLPFSIFIVVYERGDISLRGGGGGEKWDNESEDKVFLV